MFRNLLILLLSTFLLFSCSKNKSQKIVTEITDEQKAVNIYAEAVEALRKEMHFMLEKNLEKLKIYFHKVNGHLKQV